MNQRGRRFEWVLWAGLLLVIATIFLAYLLAQLRVRTFLGEPLPVYGQVADFTLTNQAGHAFSLADLRGHTWVADIIFTRCAGPCLKMSRLMKELQDALPASSNAKLISLTTDPDYDTPAILKAYGQRFGANPGRWLFLTGSKKEIAALAINSLKLTAVEKQPQERESPADLFVHSTIFVVVDPRGQLRGVFETTGEGIDAQQVKTRLQAALRRLERER
jgi:cytochrome oxidase Cu insertion factor (SCO1/SenC/PrrC family)